MSDDRSAGRTRSVPYADEGPVPTAAMPARQPDDARVASLPRGAAAFTDAAMLRPTAEPPQSGWRRAAWQVTGGRWNPGPSERERIERTLQARARTPIAGSRRVAVISRKGGVGKTTTTLLLGHTFAALRGDRVVALDANPDAGSLGWRVRRQTPATVTSVLADRDHLARYADVRAYTSQAPTRLEVIAADDDPGISEALGDDDYRAAVAILDRHYNLILLDSGTGILDSATRGVLSCADQLVVVAPPALDGARVAAQTLDWLDAHGQADLAAGAVVAVNGVKARETALDLDLIEGHFAERCAAVVRVPWDRHLEAGAEVDLERLAAATRRAYLELAASVAEGFAAASHQGRNRHR